MNVRNQILLLASVGLAACGSTDEDAGAPALEQVRITRLELARPAGPIYLNERLPLTLGITAVAADPTAAATLPVVVSFVDASDPDNGDLGCSSNGLDLELVGDGTERAFETYVWPVTECATIVGRRVALKIEIDPAADDEARPLGVPLVTSAERAADAVNRDCRGAEPGCVIELDLEFSPTGLEGKDLVHVEFADFAPDSSVMLFPPAPELFGGDIDAAEVPPVPSLAVRTALLLNGRDPYAAPVDPARIPEDLREAAPDLAEGLRFGLPPDQVGTLDDLPAPLRVRYAFSAASDQRTWEPLAVGAEDGRVAEAVITELTPGTANVLAHELYMEETARAALFDENRWLGEELFTVRACLVADFEQLRGAPGECRTVDVVLVADSAPESGAASLSFDKDERGKFGNDRISVESSFLTRNRLDIASGVSVHGEGRVTLSGKIGRSFSVDLVAAHATARGPATGDAGADMALRLFGITVDSFEQSGAALGYAEEIRVSRSRKVVDARFMFGPIPLNFDLHAGGAVGIAAQGTFNLAQGEAACRPRLPGASPELVAARERLQARRAELEAELERAPPQSRALLQQVLDQMVGELNDLPAVSDLSSCAGLDARVSPFFNLSANAFGGINIRIAKAGVEIDLTLLRVDFPLDGQLSFGRDVAGQFLVHARTQFGIELRPLDGDVKLVGEIGFRRFKRRRTVTIVSFSAGVLRKDLLDRSMPAAEVLFR